MSEDDEQAFAAFEADAMVFQEFRGPLSRLDERMDSVIEPDSMLKLYERKSMELQ